MGVKKRRGKVGDDEGDEEEILDPHRHDGKVVISEVAYCLVSSHCIQTLAYYILKRLADTERELGIIQDSSHRRDDKEHADTPFDDSGDAHEAYETAISKSRNNYLREVHMSLTRWCISGGIRKFAARSSQLFTNCLYANGLEESETIAANTSNIAGGVTISNVISVNDGFAPFIPCPSSKQASPRSGKKRTNLRQKSAQQ